MGTKSKRLMVRRNVRNGKRRGQKYYYFPRRDLLQRLAGELGMSENFVIEQIQKERKFLLKEIYG